MNLKKSAILFATTILPLIAMAQNRTELSGSSQINLIPKPQHLTINEGAFKLTPNTIIITPDEFVGTYLQQHLNAATEFNISVVEQSNAKEDYIKFNIGEDKDIPKEGYELKVTPSGVVVDASTNAGAFYAVQTILQLLPPTIYGNVNGFEKWEIPAVEIKDYPRFAYRGMMLDVSRTFFDKEFIYKYIEWLAYHKINTFHWHITDDTGWRIEIKKYPLLTSKGAWRGPGEALPASYGSGNKRYGGFYTQKEIREIIKFAQDRNIEIIPEIDMPGHSKAVIATYPETGCTNTTNFVSVNGEVKNIWCVGNVDNYKMLDGIIKEIAALFPSKFIHIGGDEVNMDNWNECPTCQAFMKEQDMTEEVQLLNYFVRQLEKIVNKYGKTMAGWDEILDGGELREDTRVYAWRTLEKGIESVKKGQPTVMQIGEFCYFDMKQSPIERGHNWAAIVTLERAYSFDPVGHFNLSAEEQKLILGPQGALWTELLNKPARFVEYQNYPRTCAMAEIGWTNQELREFNDFSSRLINSHYERLINMDIAFRVPYPIVTYTNNTLKVELPYSSAVVRYTTDGSEPTYTSPIYTGDIVTYEPQGFRFATFYNNWLKSITVPANNINVVEYIKPEVEIESSFGEQPRFPTKNVKDYNFDTYWRTDRTGVAGDYVTYKFKEPVKCKSITIETAIPNIDFYGVTDGYIEYSYDGINWIKGPEVVENVAKIIPTEAVWGVKVILTDTTDALTVVFQDLKVEAL